MKHNSTVRFYDAGDDESVLIETLTELCIWITLPESCTSLSVYPTFINEESWSCAVLNDECGYSDFFIGHTIKASVWVYGTLSSGGSSQQFEFPLSGQYGGDGNFRLTDDPLFFTTSGWDVNLWQPDERVFGRLIKIEEAYEAGDTIGIWVGLHICNEMEVNDYGINSELLYDLWLDKVYVKFS